MINPYYSPVQLVIDDKSSIDPRYHRMLDYDIGVVYERLYTYKANFERRQFSHFKRFNSIDMPVLFPQIEKGICACGCGSKLTGRRRRWATDECQDMVFLIHQVIAGRTEAIRPILGGIYGIKCAKCSRTDSDFITEDVDYHNEKDRDKRIKLMNKLIYNMRSKIELEHIIPVHKGGGGCWLDNYQFLCKDCHKEKTKQDRLLL